MRQYKDKIKIAEKILSPILSHKVRLKLGL